LRAGRGVLYGVFVLAPLIGLPMGEDTLFNPTFDSTARRIFLFASGGLLLTLALYHWARERKITWRPHVLDLFAALFFIGIVTSACTSIYRTVSLAGPLWHQDGLLYWSMGFLFYIAVRVFLRSADDLRAGICWLLIGGACMAVYGLIDWCLPNGMSAAFQPHRLVGTLRNPMFAGTYLAMLLPLGMGMSWGAPSRLQRIIWITVSAIVGLGLLLTFTRGAWVGGFVGTIACLGFAVWQYRKQLRLIRPQAILVGAIIFIGIVSSMVAIPTVRQRAMSLANIHDETLRSRLVYMQSAYRMFVQHPVTGWGIGTFTLVSAQYRPLADISEGGISINQVASATLPHNVPLQLAAEAGVCGILPFLLLLGGAVFIAMRNKRESGIAHWQITSLIGMVFASFTCNLFAFDIALTVSLMWIGYALLADFTADEESEHIILLPTLLSKAGIVASFGLAILICWSGLRQIYSAYETQLGLRLAFTEARALTPIQPQRSLAANQDGIDALQRSAALPLFPNYASYRYLSLAFRERMLMARQAEQPREAATAQAAMFRYGQQSLSIVDRDPEMQLFLAIEYLDALRFSEARALLEKLRVFQPNSAQVHLLQAKLLAYQPDIPAARREAKIAIGIDPRYARAYLWYARICAIAIDTILLNKDQNITPEAMIRGRNVSSRSVISEACDAFEKAQHLQMPFMPSDHLKYATALLLSGQTDEAIAEGRLLQSTKDFTILCRRIQYFEFVKGKPGYATEILTKLRETIPATLPL
jgi:putative inorganic carbon (HCO3(-)) transporter